MDIISGVASVSLVDVGEDGDCGALLLFTSQALLID